MTDQIRDLMAKWNLLPVRGAVLPDWWIEERMSLPEGHPQRLVIRPYSPSRKIEGQVSWGLSSTT